MEKLYIGTDGEYEESETLLQEPARRGASSGWLWIEIAFRMLAERWGSWLIISLFVFFVLGFLQYLGQIMVPLLFLEAMASLLFSAGIQYAAMVQEYDEEAPAIRHLFEILAGKAFDFIVLFGLLIIVFLMGAVFFYSMALHLGLLSGNIFALPLTDFIVLLLLGLFSLSIVGFISWFAPALVFLRDENPFSAIIMSLKAGFKNIVPFAVFFIIQWLIIIGITFVLVLSKSVLLAMALGILVFIFSHIFIALCCYASYRDVWFEEA